MNFITVNAEIKCYEEVMDYIFMTLKNENNLYPSFEKVIKDLRLACEELFLNISEYAYPQNKGKVEVGCEINGEDIIIILRDSGVPFNPFELADPDIATALEDRQIGGLGIFIVKKTMDNVGYERVGGQNVIKLKKKIISRHQRMAYNAST